MDEEKKLKSLRQSCMSDPNRLLNKNLLRIVWKESTEASLDVWHFVQEMEAEMINKIEIALMNSITIDIMKKILEKTKDNETN